MARNVRRFVERVSLTLLLIVLAAAGSAAQKVAGAATGQVTDVTGAPIAGAAVVLVHTEPGAPARASTDRDGRYRIAALQAGEYRVQVSVTGFATHTQQLLIPAGQTLSADIRLQLAG